MRKLLTVGLKSKLITPQDSVIDCLKKSLQSQELQEKDVLVITSKVVAVTQGRVKDIKKNAEFEQLVKSEADIFIGGEHVPLAIKNNIFIPWAGIDRSNLPKEKAVLWPENPFETAYSIAKQLKSHYKLKNLGIIITDSFCIPLRRGVSAVAIGYAGFKGVNDLRGTKDLYENELPVSQQNMADMIAVTAHLVMGESTEQMPFAIVRGADVQFTNNKPDPTEPIMDANECIFAPLYSKNIIDNKK